jgi:hypothetical protein
MKISLGKGTLASAFALVLALVTSGIALAQEQATTGTVVGEVDRCTNGQDIPALGVSVGVQGGSTNMAQTDANGQFTIALAPGEYTVVATADDGSSVNRQYVPVAVDQSVDIGVLELNTTVLGCGVSLADLSATPTPVPSTPSGGG